jgi:hypothetical protein
MILPITYLICEDLIPCVKVHTLKNGKTSPSLFSGDIVLNFNQVINIVFVLATILVVVGLLIDQIRLMARVRSLEMAVFKRSMEEQNEFEEKF